MRILYFFSVFLTSLLLLIHISSAFELQEAIAGGALSGFGSGVAVFGGGALSGVAGGEAFTATEAALTGQQYSFDPSRSGINALIGLGTAGIGYGIQRYAQSSKSNFVSQQSLSEHFKKHGGEFGFTSEKDYLATARNLANSKVGGDIQGYVRPSGDVVRYNTKNNAFVVKSKEGVIRTFFRPREGSRYYSKDRIRSNSNRQSNRGSGGTRR